MTRSLKLFWLTVLGFFGLHGTAAFADTYVLCSAAGELQGESAFPGASKCIDVLSWSWGQSESPGSGVNPAPSLQDLSFAKPVDTSSDDLFLDLVTHKVIKGPLEFRGYADCGACDSPTPYLTIRFKTVYVDSQQMSGAGGSGNPTESVSLSFDAVSFCYRPTLDGDLQTAQCKAFSRTSNSIIPAF